MKLILLEAVSPEVNTYIASWNDKLKEFFKFFDIKKGVFKDARKFVEFILSDPNTYKKYLFGAINLCKIEREFSKHLPLFINGLIRVQYPNLSKDELTLEMLQDSADKTGYDITPAGDKITFKNKFINKFISEFDRYARINLRFASFLFAYLYVNVEKNKLNDEDVEELLDNSKSWFGSSSINDARFKLDTYIWLKSAANKKNYELPEDFDFYTVVNPNGKEIGDAAPDGTVFGELDSDSMKRWLGQFKLNKDKINLFRFWDDLETPISNYKQAEQVYKSTFDAIDSDVSQKIFKFLQSLKGRDWASNLKRIVFDDEPDSKKIFDGLKSYIETLSQDTSEETEDTPESPTEGAPRFAPEKKGLTGIGALKKTLKLKGNPTVGQIKDYAQQVAERNKLTKRFGRVNWSQFIDELTKPITYNSAVRGTEQLALDDLIVKLLKQY